MYNWENHDGDRFARNAASATYSGHSGNLLSPGKSPRIPGLCGGHLDAETKKLDTLGQFGALPRPQSPARSFESPEFYAHPNRVLPHTIASSALASKSGRPDDDRGARKHITERLAFETRSLPQALVHRCSLTIGAVAGLRASFMCHDFVG
jgi:hypothetical protein